MEPSMIFVNGQFHQYFANVNAFSLTTLPQQQGYEYEKKKKIR